MKIWAVYFGNSKAVYHTHYHAEQFARALRLNGTSYKLVEEYAALVLP